MKSVLALAVVAAGLTVCRADEGGFAVTRGIPYYAKEAYTGDYMRAYCKLDLRVPKGTNGFATIVSFHGGGLVRGQRGDFSRTKRDDVASVSAGYRLLTNATPVECVSDAAAAVAWTLKHIAEYGGDPKKVFVTGYSGGGYLAMMVGMDPKWLKPHGFRPVNLAGIYPQTGQASTHFTIRKANGDETSTYVMKVDEWAPLAYAARDLPPILLMTGEPGIDIPCRAEENRLLYASLKAVGHPDVECRFSWGRGHNNLYWDTGAMCRDFIYRRIRQIDGAAFSLSGENPVRTCLERGVADGLETDIVSLVSDAAYEHDAVCVQKRGNSTDFPGDGEWMRPLLEKIASAGRRDVKGLVELLGMKGTKLRKGKDGVERWETTADDAIRLAELVAHRGTWHGKSLVPAETAAAEFPLPYVFADRLVAGTDGSSAVFFTRRDVSKEPSFVHLTAAWRRIIGK